MAIFIFFFFFFFFFFFASALSRSVKIVIWQAHWLDLVGGNLCATIIEVFLNFQELLVFCCHILASAFPRSRKRRFDNSFVWILSILMCIQNLSHFCFGVALVKKKCHLANVLARSCRYLSICQKVLKYNCLSVMAGFSNLLRTDRRTDRRTM